MPMASTRNVGRLGLGDVIQRLTEMFGVEPCGACAARARKLNAMLSVPVPLDLVRIASAGHDNLSDRATAQAASVAAAPCWWFAGRCTGFGRRQCVTAPQTQSPDAIVVEQCCGGWFQYPWIEVCPGQNARSGCGFCVW